MLTAQWHKVLNDLWGNKSRTLLIVLSIAVGLIASGGIISTRSVLARQMSAGYAAINPPSGSMRTLEPFDQDFVRSVRAMKDVADADARRQVDMRIQSVSGKWYTLRLFGIADYDAMRVNKIEPQSGAWPPPEHEVLIERSALSLIGAQVGDTVMIETPDEKRREVRIAGLTHDLSQFPSRFTNTAYAYVSLSTLEWLGEPHGFNELYVVTRQGDSKTTQQVMADVEDKAKRSGLTVLSTSTARFPLEEIVQTILLLLSILGVMALGLSAFLIVNTISALVAQQVRQIGVMKAIGARTSQVFSMYLAMVVLYGLLALALAVPIGLGVSFRLSGFATDLLNFDLGSFRVPVEALALQVAIGLIVPVGASLYPFLSNLRISAAEAMSGYASQGPARPGLIDRALSGANLWFARRLPVRSLVLSLRNTFRSKGRLAFTLVTLTLAGAIFISVFSVRASLFRTLDDLSRWKTFDSTISFTRPYRSDKIEQEALGVPGVTQADVWINIAVRRIRPDKTESDPILLFAPQPGSDLVTSPQIIQGRWLRPGDEDAIVLNAFALKKEPDLHLGDEIVFKIDDRERTWRVVGISLGGNPATAFVSYASLARLTGNLGRASALVVGTQQHDRGFSASVAAALQTRLRDAGLRANSASTTAEERDSDVAGYDILITGLLVMAVIFAIVGGLGLMGTMSINVIERTREIGVMRAIGAPTGSVAQVFVLESVLIGMLSWLFGSALALPLSKVMSNAVGIPLMGVPITFDFSLAGVGLWLAVVLLLSVLASFIPARNAARLTVREVLAYE